MIGANPRRGGWPWAIALGLPLAVLLAQQISLAGYIGGDFRIFYRAVQRYLADPALLYGVSAGTVPEAAHSLQGYLYPPPGILFLLPFGLGSLTAGFAAFSIGALVAALAACRLWLGWMEQSGGAMDGRLRLFLLLMALASGPVMSCRAGQVDTYVLLACVIAARLASGRHPFWAGALLATGAWLKIYPVLVMVPLLARADTRRALLAGFAAAALAVPVLTAPLLPFGLWQTYFVDLLPAMSARAIVNVYNQSLGAFVARAILPHGLALDGYDAVLLPAWLRLGVLAAGGCALGLAWARARREGAHPLPAVAIALATISLIAPLGWGHSYVYTMPLHLLIAREGARRRSVPMMLLAAAAWGMMAVSANHRFDFAESSPLLWSLLYGRYTLAGIAMIVLAAWPGMLAQRAAEVDAR